MPDAIDDLKENFKSQLRLGVAEAKSLDENFDAVFRGLPSIVIALIVIGSIIALVNGQLVLGVLGGLATLWDINVKSEFDKNRLHTIARVASQYVCNADLSRLKGRLSGIPLKSLREISWHSSFSIVFPSFGGASFPYLTSASLTPSEKKWDSFDASRYAIQLSPGVFVQYHDIHISLKCDFRVIRTPMTREEVTALFKTIVDTLSSIPPDGISIRQYSSTKSFLFKQDYVDSGTIDYIKSRSSQRILQITEYKAKVSQSASATASNQTRLGAISNHQAASSKQSERSSWASNIQVTSTVSKLKKSLLLLSDLVEKRKDVELKAMQIAMDYELREGRSIQDVSSQNLGFDVLSNDSQGGVRRIEVKGLSGIGDVILTENELKAAKKYSGSYWLYVVENCLASDKTKLYALRDFSSSDVTPQTVAYEIDLLQQNSNLDEMYIHGSKNTGAESASGQSGRHG